MRSFTALLTILVLSVAASWAAPAGQALVEGKCSACHSLDRIKSAKKDKAGWEATVTRMIANGAKLAPAEKTAVVDYLSAGK